MAKQRKKSPRARLFVALELPDAVREGLAAWQLAELEPIPVLRPVAPEALHVTLAFLGYRPEREIERVAGLLDGIDRPAPELRFLPEPAARPPGRPRVFAIEAESEGAVALQAAVSDALSSARLYEPEKRDFWPHVTLARVRRGRHPGPVTAEPPAEVLAAAEVVLYQSLLSPSGARYKALGRLSLGV